VITRLGGPCQAPRVTARSGGSVYLFDARRIARFSARRKLVEFTHHGRRYLTEESILSLAERLAPWGFVCVHRAELVAVAAVIALHQEGTTATVELADGARVPVSRRRLTAVRRALGIADPEG
jgi:DNA-binding LytR/AlgR family response regulator